MVNENFCTYINSSWGANVILVLILIGIFAGILGGMGLGGGTLLIPLLEMVTDYDHLTLQLYNLLFFYPCGIIALIFHQKNGLVDYQITKKVVILAIVGAVIGSYIATHIEVDYLRKAFGVFLIFIGLFQMFGNEKESNSKKNNN
ncbi:MAG: TSUP family transporter [Lachnospirales bacterium]